MKRKCLISFARAFFFFNRNDLRSIIYQSYLQTAAPTEKYMFDKSHFKIQSVRTIDKIIHSCFEMFNIFKNEILPMVQEFFKQPTGKRDIINVDQVIFVCSKILLNISS